MEDDEGIQSDGDDIQDNMDVSQSFHCCPPVICFFDDCPSNSKTGHEQRIPADSPLRLIVVNLLQHVRTFAAYGLSSPIMWL